MIIIHLNAQIVPSLSSGSSFKLTWVSVGLTPLFFERFLAFWHNSFRLILCLPCSRPRMSYFSGLLISFSGKWYLEAKVSCWMCLLLLGCHCPLALSNRARWQVYTEGTYVYMCMCVRLYMHTHKHLYVHSSDMYLIHSSTCLSTHLSLYPPVIYIFNLYPKPLIHTDTFLSKPTPQCSYFSAFPWL